MTPKQIQHLAGEFSLGPNPGRRKYSTTKRTPEVLEDKQPRTWVSERNMANFRRSRRSEPRLRLDPLWEL